MFVLYNNCYGGFSISKTARKLYIERKKAQSPDFDEKRYGIYGFCRHDPILIEIYNEIGREMFSDEYSNIIMKEIPNKYSKFYIITEYDGLEDVEIDHNKYLLYRIIEIINENELTSDERIIDIKKALTDESDVRFVATI